MTVWACCQYANIQYFMSEAFWGCWNLIFQKICIKLSLLCPAAVVVFCMLWRKESCLCSVKCYIFLWKSLLWLGFMNDVCHEIFSCMIEFGMVPLFSSITVHSYDNVAPCHLLLDLCEHSSHRSKIEIRSYWLVYILTSTIDFDGILPWGSCWQRCKFICSTRHSLHLKKTYI